MNNYTSSDIKVLDEITHIQKNAGMYIGCTENPIHLVEELIDNSLDEILGGNGTIIAVNIDTINKEYSVIDNARGIPIENDIPILVSTKLFSGAKFKDDKTAYKICCLIGSTKIKLLNGEDCSIEKMSKNPDIEYWGLSSTIDAKWETTKLLKARITGYTNKLIRVYIDNGLYEECTEDHRWLLKNGTYKKAADLEEGDSLMPCYMKEQEGYILIRCNNTYSYTRNIKFENRVFVPLHRIVYKTTKGKIPLGFAVHHIDTNRKNNYPNNLQILDNKKEHLPEHARINSRNGNVYTKGLIEYSKSERGKLKSREIALTKGIPKLLEYVKSEKHKKDKCELMKKFNAKEGIQRELLKNKIKKFAKALIVNGFSIDENNWKKYRRHGVPNLKKALFYFNNNIKLLIEESSNYEKTYNLESNYDCDVMILSRICSILKKIEKSNLDLTEVNYNKFRGKFDPTLSFINKKFLNFSNIIEFYKTKNHKVLKIEKINLENKIPVYDVCAPKNSNFVLSSGVVTHNSGLHGVGLATITALSDTYTIEIYRDEKHALYEFENSKFKNENIEDFNNEKPFSTKITFRPSKKYFENLIPDINRIRKRLLVASAELPNSTFVLNIDDKQEIIKISKDDFFKKYCLSKSEDTTKIISINCINKLEKFSAIFCYSLSGTTPKITTSINLLPVEEGGTHVNLFNDILKNLFSYYKKKLGFEFQVNDCLCGLRAYLSLSLIQPEFSSQAKEKLINRKSDLQYLNDLLKLEIEKYFQKNQDYLKSLLEFFEQYRRKLDSKSLKNSGVKSNLSTKFTKLRDCTGKNGELYLCEGDSSSGAFKTVRDSTKHAIFPLKGKVPNISNTKDILKNKEINELMRALGCGVAGIDFDISKLKYDKIIITTDADPDGDHISSLLVICLAILVPEVVKKGHLFIVKTPLYAINEGKIFIPLWNEEELKKAKEDKRKITRFKGIGEFNPYQIKIIALDESTRKLIPVNYTSNLNKLVKLFSNASEKRKLLLEGINNV